MNFKSEGCIEQNQAIIDDFNIMSEQEKKLLLILSIHLNKHEAQFTTQAIKLDVSLYAQYFDNDVKQAYLALEKAMFKLFDRSVAYSYLNNRGNNVEVMLRWVSKIGSASSIFSLYFEFSPSLLEFLNVLKGHCHEKISPLEIQIKTLRRPDLALIV